MGGYREERGAPTGAVLWRVTAGPGHRVLPDGAVDLLWWRERLVVAGPDTRAVLVDSEPGEEVAGLRLPPGAVDRRLAAGTPVAADAGYTDQAHLTREVSRFAGLPPGRLLRS